MLNQQPVALQVDPVIFLVIQVVMLVQVLAGKPMVSDVMSNLAELSESDTAYTVELVPGTVVNNLVKGRVQVLLITE